MEEIDQYKLNENDHTNIINKIKSLKLVDENLLKKVQYLVEVCLSFNPASRINFKQINFIISKIEYDYYKMYDIQQDVSKFRQENDKFQTKEQLFLKIRKLEEEVQNSNQKFAFEKNEILFKIQNAFIEIKKDYPRDMNQVPFYIKSLLLEREIEKEKKEIDESILRSQQIEKSPQSERFEKKVMEEIKIFDSLRTSTQQMKSASKRNEVDELINSIRHKLYESKSASPNHVLTQSARFKNEVLRKRIKDKITSQNFWDLHDMNLSKREILQILDIASSAKMLKVIDFSNF